MSQKSLQDWVIEYFTRIARTVNNDPSLLEGLEQAQGRSLLVVMSDLVDPQEGSNPSSGLLLDAQNLVRVVDPGSVNPTLTVDTTFRNFMDIMDDKLNLDTAFYYNMLNVYGSRFLADYLLIKAFFDRLRAASKKLL